MFLGYDLYAGWIWKGDILVADIEELETMDASEIYSERLDAKEVIFPNENGKFIFPAADGWIKTPGGDQELRTSTLVRQRPIQGESNIGFLGESEGSLPPPQDSLPDGGEAMNDFWSMSGSFIFRHHVEPGVKLYSPREESFPIPLKYIDVSRSTHTNLDVKQEKRIDDDWNIDGSRDLSDPWTGFTQFTLLDEKAPDGNLWSGGRLTRKQLTCTPDHLWPELWKPMGKHAKLKEKQKWSEEKLHLENARKLGGIYFIDPEDTDFAETIKNARKKLETSVAPAMPCKIMKNGGSGGSNKIKTKLRVFWKLMDLRECVWEIRYRIIIKTILQEKVRIHYSTTICFTSLFLCLNLRKFLQQKQRWTRNGKNWRKFRRGTWQKSEVRKMWSMKQGRRALQFILHHLMNICHLKNAELEAKHQKYKGRVVLRGDVVKDDSGSYAVFTEQGSSASQMTAAKIMDIISRLPGCDGQAADAVSAYTQVKIGRCSKIIENSKIGMSRHLDSSTTTQMANNMHGPVSKAQSFLLNGICTVILYGKGNLRKSYWNTVRRKFPIGNVYSYTVEKGLFLSVYVDDVKNGKKETTHWSDVESTQ